LSEAAVWALTFVEYRELLARWQEGQLRDDRRAALCASILAEVYRDRETRGQAITVDDLLLHQWPLVGHASRPAAPPAPASSVAHQRAAYQRLKAFFTPKKRQS